MLDKDALAAQAERLNSSQAEAAPVVEEAPQEVAEVQEPEADNRIPYSRFDSVLQERNNFREENEALRRQLEQQSQPSPTLDEFSFEETDTGDSTLLRRIEALESKQYMTRDDMDRQYAAEALYRESRQAMDAYPDVEEAVLYHASKQEDNYGKTLVDIAKNIHEQRLEKYRGLLGESGMQAPPVPGRNHTSPPAEEIKVRSLETARTSALKKLLGQL